MGSKTLYDLNYYDSDALDPDLSSAKVIVPLVMSLVSPRRVVDVGCGIGRWLKVFREHGAETILGLDGDYVDPKWLEISHSQFRAQDLRKPFRLLEKYDLAVCLEVAEHLPKSSASPLVESLVNLAPVVLFSAAIPKQGGTGHLNEQWPEYWVNLFKQHGYRALDLVRKEIWKDARVKYWYRQNTFLFATEALIAANPVFSLAAEEPNDLLLVHTSIMRETLGLRSILGSIPGSVWRYLTRRSGTVLESSARRRQNK